jgi:pimeloyl-ACP methyl ester carboxylesterase
VVSRGGRPDLAGDALEHVVAPTLLIVGAHDSPVIPLNELARQRLRAPAELVLVPGATHLFEEPGTLGEAARLARDWFARQLSFGVPPATSRTASQLT